ncbi:MAG: GNAT family N-acetyltransferase [Actinobacteria bacterium]|nr:GNAT family N-acetyltransferase [Actinomycetota bacterium]
MEIRAAVHGDWPALWPIWHAVVAGGETYVWPPETSYDQARRLWMLPPPAEVFVLEVGGDIRATAVLKPNQPGLGDHVANASFMVHAEARGRGVGRRLAEHVLEQARASGYRAMQFNAVVATNTAAIELWRSLGFATIGTVPDGFRHAGLGLVDLLVMHRTL